MYDVGHRTHPTVLAALRKPKYKLPTYRRNDIIGARMRSMIVRRVPTKGTENRAEFNQQLNTGNYRDDQWGTVNHIPYYSHERQNTDLPRRP